MEKPSAPPNLVSPSAVKNAAARWPHWDVTEKVIGCAIEVHRRLGPGFLEDAYEEALCVELQARQIPFQRQVGVLVRYKGVIVDRHRLDLIVEGKIVVEVKAVREIGGAHLATALAYLKATSLVTGVIVNFSEAKLQARRVVRSDLITAEGDTRSGGAEGMF